MDAATLKFLDALARLSLSTEDRAAVDGLVACLIAEVSD